MANFVPSRIHLDYVETLVYTAPSNGALLLSIVAANTDEESDIYVSILVRSDMEDFHLLHGASVPVGASLSCLAGKVSLAPGDEVYAVGSVDAATPPSEFADLYVTALEM